MTFLDWTVVGAYFLGLILFASSLSRRHSTVGDYYLAGRRVAWWQSGVSTMATQLGAISFVSAPAFVALKADGGLRWLCYEFGVPIGILIAAVWIIPVIHRKQYISIYEYLETRFDPGTRTLVSFLFQLGRGLATAVSVLAGGLILSTALPVTTAQAIVIIGLVTILYDVLGGMRVVVVSDVIQMLIIVVGIAVCGATAMKLVGWSAAIDAMGPGRLRILDFAEWGLGQGGEYGFWPMAIGGIFLYASYYGCDQSQVQREMSVGKLRDVKRSLALNAFGRFPIVLLYCLMGLLIGGVFADGEQIARVAAHFGVETGALARTLQDDPDRMVPMFILTFLPAGIVGLVFVAIMSALMSSLDSAINSLSAVTMEDFYRRYAKPHASAAHYLRVSKFFTAAWGVFCVVAALAFAAAAEATRQTTIVLINAVGSLLYGPILAAFLVGVATRHVTGRDIKAGIVVGIVSNIALWQLTDVSWLWWNLAGFLVTVGSALAFHLVSFTARQRAGGGLFERSLGASEHSGLPRLATIGYTLVIIAIAYGLQHIG